MKKNVFSVDMAIKLSFKESLRLTEIRDLLQGKQYHMESAEPSMLLRFQFHNEEADGKDIETLKTKLVHYFGNIDVKSYPTQDKLWGVNIDVLNNNDLHFLEKAILLGNELSETAGNHVKPSTIKRQKPEITRQKPPESEEFAKLRALLSASRMKAYDDYMSDLVPNIKTTTSVKTIPTFGKNKAKDRGTPNDAADDEAQITVTHEELDGSKLRPTEALLRIKEVIEQIFFAMHEIERTSQPREESKNIIGVKHARARLNAALDTLKPILEKDAADINVTVAKYKRATQQYEGVKVDDLRSDPHHALEWIAETVAEMHRLQSPGRAIDDQIEQWKTTPAGVAWVQRQATEHRSEASSSEITK